MLKFYGKLLTILWTTITEAAEKSEDEDDFFLLEAIFLLEAMLTDELTDVTIYLLIICVVFCKIL